MILERKSGRPPKPPEERAETYIPHICDRLLHNAHRIELEGPSIRHTKAAPGTSHRQPEGAVSVVQLWPRPPALQCLQLLSQGDVLQDEIRPRPEDDAEGTDQDRGEQDEEPEHGRAP